MQLFQKIKKALKDEFNYLFLCEYRLHRTIRRHLSPRYTPDAPRAENDHKQVIVIFDGHYAQHDVADRLRQITTVYLYCRENGLDFRIHFTSPFQLEEYLEPANYDWRIADEQLCYNSADACAVLLDGYDPHDKREEAFLRRLMRRSLSPRRKQIHVYTNIFYAEEQFGDCFRELFRPTKALRQQIDKQITQLGGEGRYIAITAEFGSLLGEVQPGEELSQSAQEELIGRCCTQIEHLRDAQPQTTSVIVSSDSPRFLARAAELPRVHVIPDAVDHHTTDIHAKAILDFLVLSQAAEVNLLVSGRMPRSNFSRRAAQIHGRTFYEVFF